MDKTDAPFIHPHNDRLDDSVRLSPFRNDPPDLVEAIDRMETAMLAKMGELWDRIAGLEEELRQQAEQIKNAR